MTDTKIKYPVDILDKLFAHSIDMLCILSKDGRFIKINSEWENVLGYKASETEGLHYTDLVHPDDIGKTLEAFASLLNNDKPDSFTNRYKHKNGTYRWLEWKGFVDETLLFASVRDITVEIETSKKLEEREEQYHILNELSDNFILKVAVSQNNVFSLVYASDNLSKYINRMAIDILDYDLWLKYFHKDDISSFLEFLLRLIETASIESHECRLKTNGEYRWYNIMGKPEKNIVNQRVIYIVFAIKDITDLKNTQENIVKSEVMLRSFFNESAEGILIVNEEGNVAEWNKSATRITGLSRKDVINKSWWNLNEKLKTSESDFKSNKSVLEEKIREILKTGNFNIPIHSEFPIKSNNGELRYIESRLFIIKSKKAFKLAQIFTDITERVNTEAELKRGEFILRATMESINDGLIVVKNDKSLSHKNSRLNEILGIDYILPERTPNIIPYDYVKGWIKDLQSYLKRIEEIYQSNSSSYDFLEFNDGRVIEQYSNPLKLRDTAEFGRVWIFRDITERKHNEDLFRENQKKFQIAFEYAPFGMNIMNNERKYIAVNPALTKMVGYTAEELLNESIDKVSHPADIERTHAWINKTLAGDYSEPELEKRYLHKNGNIVWAVIRSYWVRNEDGSPRMAIAHIYDITERKKAEDEILQLNKELEKKVEERTQKLNEVVKDLEAFTYSVSHDLRAPVRHIDGFIKLLFAKLDHPSDQVTGYLNKVKDATQHMTVMIDSLLLFSRLGRKELSFTDINTETLVREIIDEFKPDTEQRDISWNILSLPNIKGDKNAIKIAFENLISNAIKYTSKKAQAIIDMGGNVTDDFTEIYIRDNGIGFDMNYSNKLFNVFQRLHSSDDYEGIGIGLANVKQIIEKHKGSIRAESKIEEGATFYIKLPNT
jgi:PAS domain S-box-containing protein